MVVERGGIFTGEFILQSFPDRRRCSVCGQDREPGRVDCFEVESRGILISVLKPLCFILVFEISVLIEFFLRLFFCTVHYIPAAKHLKNVFACFTPLLVSPRTGNLR
jgi:hypothetical protein